MCGIAGVVGSDQNLSGDVRVMCESMVHRGPDDDGYFDEPGAHLGMRRLAVIDVAHGAQPMSNEDGSVVTVFNGEIYNYRQIQQQLRGRGHTLATDSDTECLVHLYEDQGSRLLRDLRGMFGLAIWDRHRQALLLARDRAGKKPLYYYQDAGCLWFASELKCLMALRATPTEVETEAIYRYLSTKYVPDPLSILRGVHKLPPAHRLIWQAGKVIVERYWGLEYPSVGTPPSASEDELAEQLRQELLDATRVRMVSERPLGVFLSGGLDSSAIVAAMSRNSPNPIRTFSIGFAHDQFNELPHARRVAELYSTRHEELVVEPDIAGLLPRIARAFDEPFADTSAVPSFYLAEMARRDVVVVLNGDGGDEALGGYTTYLNFLKVPPNAMLPNAVVTAMRAGSEYMRQHPSPSQRMNRALSGAGSLAERSPWQRFGRLTSTFTPQELHRLLTPPVREQLQDVNPYDRLEAIWRQNAHADPVNRMLAMDVGTYLPGDLLPKVDISTMAVSLEARSPFLDHQFMEWASTLPGDHKVRAGSTKYLLKKALSPWLPRDLVHRPKMGFGIPVLDWLQGPLRALVSDALLSDTSQVLAWCDRSAVQETVASLGTKMPRPGQVWTLLMLELWARECRTLTR